jgi:hypothetical protein
VPEFRRARSGMSVNYSADLRTRVEPCFFGGTPDCRECGCAVTAGLPWVGEKPLIGLLRVSLIIQGSVAAGSLIGRLRRGDPRGVRRRAAVGKTG